MMSFYFYFIYFILFFLTSLLEYNCFTVVCQFLRYNKVNQLYIYIYPHISSLLHLPTTLPIPPFQVVTKHRHDLPVLCGCFPLAIYFTFGSVYMSMPLFHFVPAYPSPSPCPQVHSLHLRLYSCPTPRFFRTNFLFVDSIYMCQHTIHERKQLMLDFIKVRDFCSAKDSFKRIKRQPQTERKYLQKYLIKDMYSKYKKNT